jgi:hypothetical protein
MKNLFFVLCFIIGLSTVIKADSWALPTTEKYCSENKKYCLKVEPKKLESQLSYFQDKVKEKENAGAAKNVKENFCKGTFYAKGKKLWSVKLDNEVSPVSALVSNNGDYVITFDNWHGIGYGDNVVTIYDAANGNLIKKLGLSDFLTESDIYNLPHSVSSIQWNGEHKIDYGKKQLVLKVAKSGRNNPDYFDVRIDLTNGAVLDEVIDRLRSLQFLLSTKEAMEKETSYTVKSETALCQDTENLTQLSTSELNKKIISKSMPEYPPAAKAVRAIGESVFEVVISENGEVECVNPISGHPLLRATLINSIKKWKFENSQDKYMGRIVIEGKSVLILNGKVVE